MNILFISHNIYPCKTGGAEIFNYYLVKFLSKFYNMFVLTLCDEDIGADATVITESRRKFGLARISIPLQDLSTIIKLRKKIDLIHISYMRDHWFKWLPYPILKNVFNIPYIITIHGGGMHPWRPVFPHKFLFRNAAEIIGVSQRIKDEYERRSNRNITYIPPLIPFNKCATSKLELRKKYGFKISDVILLFLGSIKTIKGCDTLINAFIGLGRDYVKKYHLKLLLAGDGKQLLKLKETVREQNYESYVKFLGNVPNENVSSVYVLADIYILPSLFEGTPISMLEAMFNSMPIIASNVGGINSIIENEKNGLLFEVNNSDDLKIKIMKFIENRETAKYLALRAKKDYESTYNFDVVVEQYRNIYENIIGISKK